MKKIVLIGMPNTGKSTLLNRLTGAHAKVGNWPGLTVSLLSARLLVGDHMAQLIDLPGIYDLSGYSEDERVVTTYLETQKPDLILFMMNASQVDRQLTLLSQVTAQGIPVVMVMNMADEASALGITMKADVLSQHLGMPVCLLSAKYGRGTEQLQKLMREGLKAAPVKPLSPLDVEAAFTAGVMVPAQASHQLTERIDKVLLHPWLGLPIFFAVMLLLFEGVFAIGKPLQDGMTWLLAIFRTEALEPLLSGLPNMAQGLLLDGLYNGIGTVASFVPLIILFFLFLGMVEDTGYLSRAAFLMDAWMSKFGLDGRSFVMLLMGFGCNVPALLGTRVIRSKGLRYLTMLTIPFSLCSARLQVFVLFIAAMFTTEQAPWVLFSLYVVSILMAMLTSLIFQKTYVNVDAFVLEIPPYRLPTLRQMVLKGWQEVRHFLSRTTRFIMLGVLLIWVLTNFPQGVAAGSVETWAGQLSHWISPLLKPLGINEQLTIALVFGFVAKEVVIGALAVIYGHEGQALMDAIVQNMDWISAYSFMLFALIYTPCVSTIATIRHETKSWAFTALSVAWPLCVAWWVSFAFYQSAQLIRVHFF
jgi:ferrous iron transport protein B